ncbi:hypothetical protein HK102_012991 [Quaeritorhiza haematococci]|nr:hypothetical protein HK102_012991 [Quaeritorhiza haematococci]
MGVEIAARHDDLAALVQLDQMVAGASLHHLPSLEHAVLDPADGLHHRPGRPRHDSDCPELAVVGHDRRDGLAVVDPAAGADSRVGHHPRTSQIRMRARIEPRANRDEVLRPLREQEPVQVGRRRDQSEEAGPRRFQVGPVLQPVAQGRKDAVARPQLRGLAVPSARHLPVRVDHAQAFRPPLAQHGGVPLAQGLGETKRTPRRDLAATSVRGPRMMRPLDQAVLSHAHDS